MPDVPNGKNRRISRAALKSSILLALVVAAAASPNHLPPTFAQGPAVSLDLLAAGFSSERHIRIRATGPSDVLQTRIVVEPGGDTGWHTHPGPVIVVVKSGTLTEFHENGCVSVHQPGAVFFEAPGEAHRVINDGTVTGEAYATFLIPHGSQPLEPVPDPGPATCQPQGGHHDGDGQRE